MSSDRRRTLPLTGRLGDAAGAVVGSVARGVDLDALLEHIDPDALLDRIDPNRLLDRVDPDRLLDRVDPNRLLDRVDPNRLLDRVDPDRLLDRVDPDRLLERVDVERLVVRAGIAEIVADSTGQVAGSALDSVRRQVFGLDLILMRVLYRLTGREFDQLPSGPREPVQSTSGRYAGLLSRALAFLGDLSLSTALYTSVLALGGGALERILGIETTATATSRPVFLVLLVLWWALYWAGALTLQGRTPAMAVLGLRVVGADGGVLRPTQALVWMLVLPLSALLFGSGFALMLLGNRRRTLHDRAAGAAMIYDWGAAPAATPLARWISGHSEPPTTGGPSAPGSR